MSTVLALERVPLSELLGTRIAGHHGQLVEHTSDHAPVVPFAAFRDEIPVIVTGLMERTAAYHALGDKYDTGVIRLDRVFVDPASIEWKPKVVARDVYRRWNGAQAPDPKGSVAKSDARALADQARKREQAEREESLRRASVATTAEEGIDGIRDQAMQALRR